MVLWIHWIIQIPTLIPLCCWSGWRMTATAAVSLSVKGVEVCAGHTRMGTHNWWPVEVLWCCVILHQQLSFSAAQEMLQVLQEHYECCKAKHLKVRQCPNEIASETLIQNHVDYEMLFNCISPPACFSAGGNNSRSLYSPVELLGQQSPDAERPFTDTCKDCELLYSPSAQGQVCANEIWRQTLLMETGSRLELSFLASSRRV